MSSLKTNDKLRMFKMKPSKRTSLVGGAQQQTLNFGKCHRYSLFGLECLHGLFSTNRNMHESDPALVRDKYFRNKQDLDYRMEQINAIEQNCKLLEKDLSCRRKR